MLDRVIGIAGLVLTIILSLWDYAPERWSKAMPAWLWYAGMAFAVFLIGLSAGLLIADHRNKGEENQFVWKNQAPATVVSNQRFVNERVLLDGSSFVDCYFENVTFVYNGTAPFKLQKNSINGRIQFGTDNPQIGGAVLWLRGLGALRDNFEVITPPGVTVEAPTIH